MERKVLFRMSPLAIFYILKLVFYLSAITADTRRHAHFREDVKKNLPKLLTIRRNLDKLRYLTNQSNFQKILSESLLVLKIRKNVKKFLKKRMSKVLNL